MAYYIKKIPEKKNKMSLLNTTRQKTTLVTYVFHEFNERVSFFLKYGIRKWPGVDFHIVKNTARQNNVYETKKINDVSVTWIERPNINIDFGGYLRSLLYAGEQSQKYDYYLFLNSTVLGPFFPTYVPHEEQNWIEKFTQMLVPPFGISGISVNCHENTPHVQSMLFALTAETLSLVQPLFPTDQNITEKGDIINQCEIGMSTLLRKQGYQLNCLLTRYRNIKDWDVVENPEILRYNPWDFTSNNVNIHPYETIFIKANNFSQLEPFQNFLNTYHQGEILYNQIPPGNQRTPQNYSNKRKVKNKIKVPLIIVTTITLVLFVILIFVMSRN